jgi:hypothetical protein
MSKHLLLAAALGLATAALAQPTAPAKLKTKTKPGRAAAAPAATDWSVPYAASITPAALQQDLAVLAADAYEGRATGQQGQRRAASYLAQALATAGLAGPVPGADNPYFQQFTINRTELDPDFSVKIGDKNFVVNKDFYLFMPNPAAMPAVVQPAFVGYGISTAGYADFAPGAPELKGKDLVLLLGEPLTKTGQPLLGKSGQPSAYGAAGFTEMTARSPALRTLVPHVSIRIEPSAAAFAQAPQAYEGIFTRREHLGLPSDPAPAGQGVNLFVVSPAMGAALLGTTPAGLARYQQAVAKAGRPIASPFRPVAMTLPAPEKTGSFTTENVLGYLEGTDKKDEVLVLMAHYDHVGVQAGAVYNGADDNGSGTVSLLALARAFAQAKKDGHGPRRSILFLASVGEENGLLGSRHYTDYPVFPLASTVAALNIDMIGRTDSVHAGQGDYLYLTGAGWASSELNALSEATNQQYSHLALDYKYNNRNDPTHLYRRSDHFNFARHQVPVIYYTSGLHADYHQPTDDVEKIDFPAMARRDQLVFHTAWALANRASRLAIDAPNFQP